jgi:tRNA(Ile)-lysidine synthase
MPPLALQALDRRLDYGRSAPLAVAFSGGSDSLALLLLAKAWADRAGRPLLALTVDHGLQRQSGAWTQACGIVARRLGADFQALAWRGDKPATGVPAAARAARHRLIAQAARQAGASVVLVGHTFDDQLENALMRGAGERVGVLGEWSASPVWPEGRGVFHLRPLLAARRADLRAWLTRQGLSWIDDPANESPVSPRARARALIAQGQVPRLDPEPADEGALRRLAQTCHVADWGGILAPRATFEADEATALRLLQIVAACAAGRESLGRPYRAQALLRRLQAGERFVASLGGARLEAGRRLLITREAGEFDRAEQGPITLAVGQPVVWDGRFELLASRPGLRVAPLKGQAIHLKIQEKSKLGRIPAAGRGALPAVREEALAPTCPILAGEDDDGGATARGLVRQRFEAASGMIAREGESSMAARMANWPQSSYVEIEAKGLFE